MSMPYCLATASMRSRGPTRIGAISPSFAASAALRSELSSQGWATAVGVGGKALQKSSNRWYLSCLRSIIPVLLPVPALAGGLADGLAGLRPRSPSAGRAGTDVKGFADVLDHRELLGRGLGALHPLIGQQAPHQRHQLLAVLAPRQQLRQRRERLLGLVADDDLLLAAD